MSARYRGYKYDVEARFVSDYWQHDRTPLRPLFCTRIPTETRITDSNPPQSIALLEQPPQHPIHVLQRDDRIEQRISSYFRRAFGQDLIVYHGGGAEVPLFVGQRRKPELGEDRISSSYLKRLRNTTIPLHKQGDGMRRFVSVILNLLAFDNASVLLLDEPEAFLHPPQARLIGEFLVKERRSAGQLFIATHSADVLHGLLNSGSDKLRVLRIERRGNVNHVRELEKARTVEIARDPLLKYSSVFLGIFHQHVFICEADADCLFYNSILDLEIIQGEQALDALFIHAGGKHRMAKLAAALRALDVPVSVIADIDILNDEGTLRTLFETLGGSWASVEADWRALKTAIEQHKPWLKAGEIAQEIRKALDGAPPTGEFPSNIRQRIEKVFRKASPWDVVKHGGKVNIPSGQVTQQFNRIEVKCQSVGLWIVPVGELEGLCRSIDASHGPAWVQKVLETKNLSDDEELNSARRFVEMRWNRVKS